jgi:hypothetical protein
MARLAAHDVGKLSGIRLPEETCLDIEELSPCEILRPGAAVRILTDYLLSLLSCIVENSDADGLDGNRYNLGSNDNG